MADSLPIIQLDKDQWVDIYAVSGIAVGTILEIQSLNAGDVRLHIGPDQPADADGYELIIKAGKTVTPPSPSGIWAFSLMGGAVYVRAYVGETTPVPAAMFDGNNNPLSSYYNAATGQWVLNTHDADVHNVPVNQHFHQHTGISTTLAAPTNADGSSYVITVADSTGFVAGEPVQIGGNANHTGIKIPIISVVGNDITLAARVDFGWPIGTQVEVVIIDMAVSGTLAAPQEFKVYPNADQVIHITRIIITMTHGTAGDLGLFGNLAPLPNGVLLRAFVNGQYGTFTLWRTNDEIKDDMYDIEFNTRSSGGGTYGTSGRGSFSRIGVALRLDGAAGDYVEIYIQDASPVGLDSFHIKAQGHIEGA